MNRKNPAAVALGRRGGKARAGKLTPAERSEIARKAGLAGGRGRAKQSVVCAACGAGMASILAWGNLKTAARSVKTASQA